MIDTTLEISPELLVGRGCSQSDQICFNFYAGEGRMTARLVNIMSATLFERAGVLVSRVFIPSDLLSDVPLIRDGLLLPTRFTPVRAESRKSIDEAFAAANYFIPTGRKYLVIGTDATGENVIFGAA